MIVYVPEDEEERLKLLAEAQRDLREITKAKKDFALGKLLRTVTIGSGEMQRRYQSFELTIETLEALEREYEERVLKLSLVPTTSFRPTHSGFTGYSCD